MQLFMQGVSRKFASMLLSKYFYWNAKSIHLHVRHAIACIKLLLNMICTPDCVKVRL